jgi:hypothetical protein
MHRTAVFSLLLLPAIFLGSPPAQATLGEHYVSIGADQTHMRASLKVTTRAGYEVHEMSLPSGTAVREYVTGNGVVFAIAWVGPSKPDLRQLLGRYFADYTAESPSNRGGRAHLHLERGDLVIQSSGHMRAFAGRAYLPRSLPADISTDELR